MKKTFEGFLILIIFYGVYSAFKQVAPMLFDQPNTFWVAITSLVVAAALLLLYSWIIASSAKRRLKEKVSALEQEIYKKDEEIKTASSFKENLIKEAEQTIEARGE